MRARMASHGAPYDRRAGRHVVIAAAAASADRRNSRRLTREGLASVPAGRLEQLDRIPVGIFDLHLPAARADLQLVPEPHAGLLQPLDAGLEMVDAQHDPVPPTRFLAATIRQRPRTGCAR